MKFSQYIQESSNAERLEELGEDIFKEVSALFVKYGKTDVDNLRKWKPDPMDPPDEGPEIKTIGKYIQYRYTILCGFSYKPIQGMEIHLPSVSKWLGTILKRKYKLLEHCHVSLYIDPQLSHDDVDDSCGGTCTVEISVPAENKKTANSETVQYLDVGKQKIVDRVTKDMIKLVTPLVLDVSVHDSEELGSMINQKMESFKTNLAKLIDNELTKYNHLVNNYLNDDDA